MRRSHTTCILMTVVLILIGSASGGTTTWGGGTGDWSDGSYWDNGEPASGDTAEVQSNGTAQITQLGEVCGTLNVGLSSPGNVSMTSGELTSGEERIFSSGQFSQAGGKNNMWRLKIASGASKYQLDDGEMSTSEDIIIDTGMFVQNGGTASMAGNLSIGPYSGGGKGTYALTAGALSTDKEYIGRWRHGGFTQSGGTNTVARQVYLGVLMTYAVAGTGTYDLSDGDLSAAAEYVGTHGKGTFSQTGGTNTISPGVDTTIKPDLHVGYHSGSDGTYTISKGLLDVRYGVINVGRETGSDKEPNGIGVFNLQGGTVIADELSVNPGGTFIATNAAPDANSVLRVNTLTGFGSTPSFDVDWLQIGHAGGSGSGSYLLSSGETLSGPGILAIGHDAPAVFTHSGGTNTVGGVAFGTLLLGGTSAGDGTYYLSGTGQLSVYAELIGPYGKGTFHQSGGTNDVNLLRIGSTISDASQGIYTLSGPLLTSTVSTKSLQIVQGVFKQTGGTVIADQYLGMYAGSARYELSGGELYAPVQVLDHDDHLQTPIVFAHSGGFNNVSDRLEISSLYELSGTGELWGQSVILGGPGCVGSLIQTGGVVKGSEVHDSIHTIALGEFSGESGNYEISEGSLIVMHLNIGLDGCGSFAVRDAAALIEVWDTLKFGGCSRFSAVPGSVIHQYGADFVNESTTPEDLAGLANLELIFEGGNEVIDTFEVAGNRFMLGTLTIGGERIGQVQLVDDFDNQPGRETLYVRNLTVNAGSYLDLNGLDLYYTNAAVDEGATIVLNGGGLYQVVCGDGGHPYPTGDIDHNCRVDLDDFQTLARHWLDTNCVAPNGCDGTDLDDSGAIDLVDVSNLAAHWLECTAPECFQP